MTITAKLPAGRRRAARLAVTLIGLSVTLGACKTVDAPIMAAEYPDDYRLRHPIAVTEADRSIVVFVGTGRGGMTAAQRADVMGIARDWVQEGTGSVVVDVPVDTANGRAAAATYREIRAVLAAGGVPARGIVQHPYHPDDPGLLPTIRLSYSKITAVAGPCGLWPEDVGPGLDNPGYNENKPYYNLGCATQRNLAAMVDNPADLEQPRPESPAYTMRRTQSFEKYRKGVSTTTIYPESDKAKLSDTGK